MYISDAQWRCGDPYRGGFQPIDRVVNDVIAVTSEPGEITVRADPTFLCRHRVHNSKQASRSHSPARCSAGTGKRTRWAVGDFHRSWRA